MVYAAVCACGSLPQKMKYIICLSEENSGVRVLSSIPQLEGLSKGVVRAFVCWQKAVQKGNKIDLQQQIGWF